LENDTNNKFAFIEGALFALIIMIAILAIFWVATAQPWLHGVAYNMQLDESVLRHFGITPTSNYQAMWNQVARLTLR
jgi:hypothetical protein